MIKEPELWYRDHGRWPTLDDVLPDSAITKLTLPAEHRRELACALDAFSVSPATLRPSFAGASDAILKKVKLGLIPK